MRSIIWAEHGRAAFDEILLYVKQNSGVISARNIYKKVISALELLKSEEITTRKSVELCEIGIDDIYELNVNPWKVYYKISKNNKQVVIMYIIDMRRNITELLLRLILGK